MDAKQIKDEGLKLYRDARYEEAAAKFAEAQPAFVTEGNGKEAAECLNNRGVCWRQAAKFDEATAAFEEARAAFQALNDAMGEAHNPYGDGRASQRITAALLGHSYEPFAA